MSIHGVAAVASRTFVVAAAAATAATFAVVGSGDAHSTYEGSSPWLRLVGTSAAVSLIVAALVLAATAAMASAAFATAALALAWLAPVVVGWQTGPARTRTAGAIAAPLCAALVALTVTVLPLRSRQPASILRRVAAGIAAVAVIAAATILALVRDPLRDLRCWSDCTVPPVLPHHGVALVLRLTHNLAALNAAVAILATLLAGQLFVRASDVERRAFGPALIAAMAAGLAYTAYAVEVRAGPPETPTAIRYEWLFAARGTSLLLLAAALAWCALRPRLVRGRVSRLALDLERSAGGLASVLTSTLGDDDLSVLFPVAGGIVDADGSRRRHADIPATATPIVGSGGVLAYVDSSRFALDDVGRTLGPAAELALGNDRLRAEALARLQEVTESRARLVEATEIARRRMERDLHDGAQQVLLALGYDLLAAISEAERRGNDELVGLLRAAHGHAAEAGRELREIAGGIYPPALHSYGLIAALDSLADIRPLQLSSSLPADRRYPGPVEAAAYAVVAEAVSQLPSLAVAVSEAGGRLELALDGWDGRAATWFEDRAGAVGGTVAARGTTLAVSFPVG